MTGCFDVVPDLVFIDMSILSHSTTSMCVCVLSQMQGVEASMQSIAAEAARRLVGLALDRGSFDDISVLVNLYSWGPNIVPPVDKRHHG